MTKNEDIPELKLSGKRTILCTSAYLEKKKNLSRILGISLTEADKILQDKGVDRMSLKETEND